MEGGAVGLNDNKKKDFKNPASHEHNDNNVPFQNARTAQSGTRLLFNRAS